jgi:hypothetical protein
LIEILYHGKYLKSSYLKIIALVVIRVAKRMANKAGNAGELLISVEKTRYLW